MKNKVLLTVSIIFCLMLTGCQFIQGDVGTISNEQTNQAAGTLDNVEVNPEVKVDVMVDNSENTTNETISNMTIDEYESLKKENITLENENQELKKQLGSNPSFEFKTLGLYIDGESIPINSNNSVVVVNGVNYYSEDIIKNLISNNNVEIKAEGIYIGRIVKEQTNLVEEWIVDRNGCRVFDRKTDSYGNTYTECLVLPYGEIIFNLNREFSFLKCDFSMSSNVASNTKGNITIKADDEVVYTNELDKFTEPILEQVIPIKNCSLLKIYYDSNSRYSDEGGIISNAILFN